MTPTTRYSYDRRASTSVQWVTGGGQREILDQVWAMYETSYSRVGMHIPNAPGLLKYDKWEIAYDGDTPIAFNLYKTTKLGLKAGLVGSDGSSQGKSWVKGHVKRRFNRPGVYGEVSHGIERLTQGVPVVCAVHVPKVLQKPVAPEDDGVHYKRKLRGMGWVTKKLIGNPKGGLSGPEGACPIPAHPGETLFPRDDADAAVTASEEDGWMEAADHSGCQYLG